MLDGSRRCIVTTARVGGLEKVRRGHKPCYTSQHNCHNCHGVPPATSTHTSSVCYLSRAGLRQENSYPSVSTDSLLLYRYPEIFQGSCAPVGVIIVPAGTAVAFTATFGPEYTPGPVGSAQALWPSPKTKEEVCMTGGSVVVTW